MVVAEYAKGKRKKEGYGGRRVVVGIANTLLHYAQLGR